MLVTARSSDRSYIICFLLQYSINVSSSLVNEENM